MTPEPEFRLRSVAVPAYGPTVLEAIGYGAAVPITPLLARELGATLAQAALVAGLLGLGQITASLPAGALIGRIGERRAMIGGSFVAAVCAVASGLAPTLLVLAVATFATGMTWSVFLLARQGFVIDAVPDHKRARALSTLGGSHRIGLVLGPLLGTVAVGLGGVRAAYAITVVASLVALALARIVPDLSGAAREAGRADPASVWRVLADNSRTLLTLGTSIMVISALRSVRMAVVPLWADQVGLGAAQVSLIFAISGAFEVLLFYPAGWVMDRFGRVLVAVPTVVALALGMLVLPSARSFPAVLAVALLMSLGNGLGSGIVMTLGADTAPTIHRAKYLGGWRLFGDIGSGGGPLVVSALVTLVSLAAASMTVGALALAASVWVGYWVRGIDRARRWEDGARE